MLPTCLLLLLLIFWALSSHMVWMLCRPGDKHHPLDGGLLLIVRRILGCPHAQTK